jgi:hypothetical protein
MANIDNLDFLNLNSLRNYPIREGLSRVSTDGGFTIPNNFLVELQLAATYDPSRRFYISKLSNFESEITVQISDYSGAIVGVFVITTATHTTYKEYYLEATEAFVGATGIMTICSLQNIQETPTGNFTFTPQATEFEARTSIPALKGINRLIFKTAAGKTFGVTGDVEILARTNVRFSQEPITGMIVVDAAEGIGLNADCAALYPCIKTINSIPPDSDGNFTLDFSSCASLTTIPAGTGLLLEDVCCKPCQGCNDIAELTNRLSSLESQLLTLRTYYDNLNNLFIQYKTTVDFTCDCQT